MSDKNDPDPTLEDDMRAWLRQLADAMITDPAERARRYQSIETAIAILTEPKTTEPEITERGRCSACGAEIDIELIKHYDYQTDRGGVQPGTPDGPAVYWSEGTIACPGCGARLPYSEQSD